LRDLEFLQFHPTALYLPPAPPFLISETVRGEGAILLNDAGERFMPAYHPLAELAPRDVVARSIYAEIERCGKPAVFLDLSKINVATITTRFPNIYEQCLEYGLDITKSPIPVAPAAHYMMGGVVTDLWGRTAVPGLYAAGEVASTGVHGANRLASNSLLEGLVFSGRIAQYLQKTRLDAEQPTAGCQIHYPQVLTSYSRRDHDFVSLRQISDHYLGIQRNGAALLTAIQKLNDLQQTTASPFELNPGYFELQNLFFLARLMTHAALKRKESRGAHFRCDFPNPDKKWQGHITFKAEKLEVTK
jgi:L-aspartate oxidase